MNVYFRLGFCARHEYFPLQQPNQAGCSHEDEKHTWEGRRIAHVVFREYPHLALNSHLPHSGSLFASVARNPPSQASRFPDTRTS